MTDFQCKRLLDMNVSEIDKFKIIYSLCLTNGTYDESQADDYIALIPNGEDIRIDYYKFARGYTAQNNQIMKSAAVEIEKQDDCKKQSAPQLYCVANVVKKDIQFLIEPYIIKNNITAIVGDGGVGKTYIWVDIASAITNKRMPYVMGKSSQKPNTTSGKVLYFTSEDDTADTLTERFENAGADLNNLLFVPLDDSRFHNIMLDSLLLEQLIDQARPDLVVLDPLQSFVRGKMADRNNMRRQLDCLTRLAKVYDTSFIIVVHTNKSNSPDARTKLSDSSDIWDKCRSVLFVGKTSQSDIRYISQEKGNYTSDNNRMKTQLFSLVDGHIEHRGSTDKKYFDFATERLFKKDTSIKSNAKDFILELLKDGEIKVSTLKESAQAYGISEKTLTRAKNELKKANKINYRKESAGKGKGVEWYIYIP